MLEIFVKELWRRSTPRHSGSVSRAFLDWPFDAIGNCWSGLQCMTAYTAKQACQPFERCLRGGIRPRQARPGSQYCDLGALSWHGVVAMTQPNDYFS